ncbi:hypothetical protein SAMN05421504_101585 [Amycolatopsis xylanica]|uniref:Uncharacterized protein n=1 Tax=Amycolatopsis xylanica TaxID=589385 RepID=A0A1H2TLD1_9PSEU|nr:hypothetical protein [Amycolatopsis xylanica]SDW44074.1 hypothetical protein SAMN05421504_101585 [Amycolatopsis xylanica]
MPEDETPPPPPAPWSIPIQLAVPLPDVFAAQRAGAEPADNG